VTGLRRAFVAVVPPPPVLDAIAERVERARTRAPDTLRWATRAQWHVTLQFLGSVGDAAALRESIGASLRGRRPVSLRLGGAGAFPSAARGTVVWVELAEGVDGLEDLARRVADATSAHGVRPDPRPYRPHVTIGRTARPRRMSDVVDAVGGDPVGPSWVAEDVVLLESDTRPAGAVYTEVERFLLA
jgi:2'-5' RNA ligase